MPAKHKPAAPEQDFSIQRIRVRRDGYDADGAYWGAGPDVFIGTTVDGATQFTVRARSITEAREKIIAERDRPAGTPAPRTSLGGNPPSKSRYEIDWRDAANATTVRVRITHARDYLAQGQDHLEVESIAPKKATLPITATGYRSHFLNPLDLVNAGGPVTFVTAWLDAEAAKPTWRKAQNQRAQGDLFQWAETTADVSKSTRRNATKPAKSSPTKQQIKRTRSAKPDPG